MNKDVIVASEFSAGSGAPTGALVADIILFLKEKKLNVFTVSVKRSYKPGGIRPNRLINMLEIFLKLNSMLIFRKINSLMKGNQLSLIITTSPPLMHIYAVILCKVFRIHSVLWYMDAHPELELRSVEKNLGLRKLANLCRRANLLIISFFDRIITLDEAMKVSILTPRLKEKITVIPPWITYCEPAMGLRIPKSTPRQKIIYAGNYGAAHSLASLTSLIKALPTKRQEQIEFTFVGMNVSSQDRLKKEFQEIETKLIFLPRFKRVEQLLASFSLYDFGLVSLAHECQGLVCPSKALTYVSQGLPLLYVGPKNSLSWSICKEGWGLTDEEWVLSKETAFQRIQTRKNSLFENPRKPGLQQFFECIQNSK